MGIIGKTQGVKIDARPNPKATRRNEAMFSSEPLVAGGEGGGALASAKPAGMSGAVAGVEGSTFRATSPLHFPGTHWVSLQVWNRPLTERFAGPAGTPFFS